LEDETAIANTIVWPRKFEQYRPVVMGARLISVTGVLQNEKNVIHIVAHHFEDLTPLLGRLSEQADRIDVTMPPDVIKRPVYSRQRHPRSGDALVTMLKEEKPALEDVAVARDTAQVMPKGRNFH
jgi:error-prone DNA polymerase